ncbi:hypothetical protein D3C84_554450 [compost metagenome]
MNACFLILRYCSVFISFGSFVTVPKPVDVCKLKDVFPDFPVLVVISTTPLAPLEPYIDVASASLRTSILSILSGLILLSGLTPEGKAVAVRLELMTSDE